MAAAAPPAAALLSACGNPPTEGSSAPAAQTGTGAGGSTDRKVRLGSSLSPTARRPSWPRSSATSPRRSLDVSVEKQASWAATRDNLLNNEIDGGHVLSSMPLSVATGIGGNGARSLRVAMMLHNSGQAITLSKDYAAGGVRRPQQGPGRPAGQAADYRHDLPRRHHDTWLRYWLKACGVDANSLKIIIIPPAQMVANMKVDAMDGYCVGEPWGAQAVDQGIGSPISTPRTSGSTTPRRRSWSPRSSPPSGPTSSWR